MSCDDFESRHERHALQLDEKVDLVFLFLKKLAKSRFPDVYLEVKEEWREIIDE